jgi:carbamate kinase
MESRLTVLAIGGNSLIKDKNHIALSFQYESVKVTARYIADLVADGISLVITHGNGPQVGFIYRRGELAQHELPLVPLDICGADTQGAIGYMIGKALLNQFHACFNCSHLYLSVSLDGMIISNRKVGPLI